MRCQRQQDVSDAEVVRRDLSAGPQVPGRRLGRDLANEGDPRELVCRCLPRQGGANPLVIALYGVGGEFNCVGEGHA